MKKGGIGGALTKTGLNFEKSSDILSLFAKTPGYTVEENKILYRGEEVARSYRKNSFYNFLASQGVDYKKIVSKKLLPDEALFVIVNNTLYVMELKFQEVAGSVDEKLQTCDFKKKQYKKLVAPLNLELEYMYVLSDWFRQPGYKDVLDYVISVGCSYYFEYVPLSRLGLPVPDKS